MSIYDKMNERKSTYLSNEGIKNKMRAAEAFQDAANNHARANKNIRDEDRGKRLSDTYDRIDAKAEERNKNRKETLKKIGEGLIEAAKVTGKGVKEMARLAYNLALGKPSD